MSENGPSDAAIYARVSTSDQDVSRQFNEAREYLERLGVEDIEEYPEIVTGAADTDTREVYNRLLDDVETGRFDLVVVHEISRLSRLGPTEIHEFIQHCLEHDTGVEALDVASTVSRRPLGVPPTVPIGAVQGSSATPANPSHSVERPSREKGLDDRDREPGIVRDTTHVSTTKPWPNDCCPLGVDVGSLLVSPLAPRWEALGRREGSSREQCSPGLPHPASRATAEREMPNTRSQYAIIVIK
ncbi:recombinase family protein [Halorubrum sp. Atlit-28R]|uniref:recombinase family protein n=1 Tax=Halorubrum sp. Atlit-28R TaxID=2282129 RepID=UPI001F28C7C0|nr:recombinase family protein [Halorubrum sp. Atlit-28R]